jgi:hypothetical protein
MVPKIFTESSSASSLIDGLLTHNLPGKSKTLTSSLSNGDSKKSKTNCVYVRLENAKSDGSSDDELFNRHTCRQETSKETIKMKTLENANSNDDDDEPLIPSTSTDRFQAEMGNFGIFCNLILH